jgi:hypothetical protein
MGKPTAKGPNHGRDDENRAAQRQVARRGPTDLQAVCTSSAYRQLISRLRSQLRAAQAHAAQAVNSELVLLYWSIGHEILVQQHASGWGDDVVGRIARDLALETGSARGFSRRNLFYMRRFAALWPEREKVQALTAQVGWSHHQVLLDAFSGDRARYAWYASRVAQERWSYRHLKAQITLRLHERVGAAVTNFDAALGPGDAERALEAVKDPYVFDFLELSEDGAVDDQLRRGDDRESVGIILCTERDETFAELALRRVYAPIAVATWRAGAGPPELKTAAGRPRGAERGAGAQDGTPAELAELAELDEVRARLAERVAQRVPEIARQGT